jgi:hypothetical protein
MIARRRPRFIFLDVGLGKQAAVLRESDPAKPSVKIKRTATPLRADDCGPLFQFSGPGCIGRPISRKSRPA